MTTPNYFEILGLSSEECFHEHGPLNLNNVLQIVREANEKKRAFLQSPEYTNDSDPESNAEQQNAMDILASLDCAIVYLYMINSEHSDLYVNITKQEMDTILSEITNKLRETLPARKQTTTLSLSEYINNGKVRDIVAMAIDPNSPIHTAEEEIPDNVGIPNNANASAHQNKASVTRMMNKIDDMIHQGSWIISIFTIVGLIIILPLGIAYLISRCSNGHDAEDKGETSGLDGTLLRSPQKDTADLDQPKSSHSDLGEDNPRTPTLTDDAVTEPGSAEPQITPGKK